MRIFCNSKLFLLPKNTNETKKPGTQFDLITNSVVEKY